MLDLSCSATHNRSVRPPKIMLVPLVLAAMVTPTEAHARPVEPRPDRTVSLTFDDGPAPDWTPAVLAVLRRRHVQATSCMLGDNAAQPPALARQIVTEGHRVCNHSRSHADLARLSDAGVRDQVLVAQQQIRRATGRPPRD